MTFRSRLLAAGLIVPDGNGWTATPEGQARLGDYEKLPEGGALRDYWQNRLTGGEKELFEVYVAAYPNPVPLAEMLARVNFKRTSVMTFKSRLMARKLVENDRANDNLF